MIGVSELIVVGVVFLAAILFGRKAILKLVRDMYRTKKDIEKIKQEEEKQD